MRRILIALVVGGLFVLGSASLAFAADASGTTGEDKSITAADLLVWLDERDWSKGGLFAAAGLVGALVTTFGLIGGAVPGTAGKAKIDADDIRVAALTDRLQELVNQATPDGGAIAAVGTAVNEMRDDVRSERRYQFALGAAIYLLLGAAFAALIAKDLLQALVIGAGWTGVLGSLGLKRDFAEREQVKDQAIQKSAATARTVAAAEADPNHPALKIMDRENSVALAL